MLLPTFTGVIKLKRALNLIYNYHKFQHEKSISVLFPIGSPKGLMAYLKKCQDDGNTHVRIYFGQYGDNIKLNPDQDNMKKHRTVVFVPVTKGKDNIDTKTDFLGQPFDEGELCPPTTGCEAGSILYDLSQSNDTAVFNPNEIDQ